MWDEIRQKEIADQLRRKNMLLKVWKISERNLLEDIKRKDDLLRRTRVVFNVIEYADFELNNDIERELEGVK